MTKIQLLFQTVSRFHRKGLALILGLILGSGSAYAGVSVDQSPLTVRNSAPPNILLMFDDSGSMQWTVMPDNPPGNDGRDSELVNSAVNGVYYDPDTVYLPPYTATAQPTALIPTTTRFANVNFEQAWYDGFDQSSTKINIATYQPDEAFAEGPSISGTRNPTRYRVPRFSHTFKVEVQPQYDYVDHIGCPDGFEGPNADGECTVPGVPDEPPYCQGTGSYDKNKNKCGNVNFFPEPCGSERAERAKGQPNSPGLSLKDNGKRGDVCVGPDPDQAPRCQGFGTRNYDHKKNQCKKKKAVPDPCGSTRFPGTSGSVNSPGLSLEKDRCVAEIATPNCPTGYVFNWNEGPNGEDCRKFISAGGARYRSLFVYMVRSGTGSAGDPFVDVRHYVGVGTESNQIGTSGSPKPGTCGEITGNPVANLQTGENYPSGLPVDRCKSVGDDSELLDDDGNAITIGQNVANWFSYYRKRTYMARTGLMNAFASMDPAIRFGFGSINGGVRDSNTNDDLLPSGNVTNTAPKLARVTPFGNGGNGTQRASFWNWLAKSEVDGSTPLRKALKAMGEYYRTDDQPWKSGNTENSSNPNEVLSCRQSYAMLMSDGFWNGGNPSVGDADNPNSIVRRDSPAGLCFEYPKKSDGSTCTSHPAEDPYVDGADNTLADVAMKYWLTDLRSESNRVPTSSEDPAFWQHMTTFTIGLYGQSSEMPQVKPSGTAAEDAVVWAQNGGAPNDFDWPSPSSSSETTISDLVHAGINGHGGFYSAGNPQALEQGIQDALLRVQERVGTGASLAANSTRLDTGTTTYQSLYFSGKWSGDLRSFPVDPSSGAISSTPDWSASDELPAASSRNIKTCNPCGTKSNTTVVEFKYDKLSATQKSALDSSQDLTDYLRGDQSKESPAGNFRKREGLLGDVINSQPVFVGAPNPNLFAGRSFIGSSKYPSFAGGKSNRNPLLWLAANDGMLHAFDSDDGVEAFAYMPNAVILPHTFDANNDGTDEAINGIKNLAALGYGSGSVGHQFFNDGELTVADAYDGSNWKTILVGTTGRGVARAIYAVDITDPATPLPLWERAAEDGLTNSNWIGQVIGKPVIAQVADGKWAVLMGNGYNSDANKAAFLQFSLFTGELIVHSAGTSTNNGLAQAAVVIGQDVKNVSTVAWAGDLDGAVWEFDLSCTVSCSGTKRFHDSGNRPITGGMLAGKHPKTKDTWIFFGTGKNLTPSDLKNADVQRWYGLIVTGALAVSSVSTDSSLVERSITGESAASGTTLGARTLEKDSGELSGKSGWYMPLQSPVSGAQGERIVTPNQFQGSLLLATTRIPESTDPCNPAGLGWIMAVNPFTGASPESSFFDLDANGKFDDKDKLNGELVGGIGFGSIPNNPIFVGNMMLVSFDDATTSSIATSGTGGIPRRTSWRELIRD